MEKITLIGGHRNGEIYAKPGSNELHLTIVEKYVREESDPEVYRFVGPTNIFEATAPIQF